MSNLKRTLLIGAIWAGIFFLWWLKGFLYQNWNFDIFSFSSWAFLYNEFLSGWVISATSDWIFVWTLIFAVPLFLIGWNLFLKVKWKELFKRTYNKIKYFFRGKKAAVTNQKFKYVKKKSHKKVRPVPLYASAKAIEKKAAETPNTQQAPAYASGAAGMGTSSSQTMSSAGNTAGLFGAASVPGTSSAPKKEPAKTVPSFLDDEDFANIPLDDIKMPERTALNEDIPALLIKAGYKVVADVDMDGTHVDYVAIDSVKILLMVLDTQKGDWLADEERFNNEDPLWFSESSHRTSPVYMVSSLAKSFEDRLHKHGEREMAVKPVLVEKEGNIINAEDMISTWEKSGVLVCRTGIGGPDELPSVEKGVPHAGEPVDMSMVEIIRSVF